MKKKIIIVLLIIILVALAIISKNKIQSKKSQYKTADIEVYRYVKYKDKEKFGVIDRDGNIIIDASYEKIEIPNPEKDLFVCYTDEEKSEVLNSKKEKILTQYDKIEPIKLKNIASTLCFEKTVLKYKKDDLYGLTDFKGKQITKNEYNSIDNLQSTEGKFLVSKNDKYGILNMNGAKLVETEYDQIITDGYYSEENNYAQAGFIVSNTTNEGYRYGYINYRGKKILNIEYNDIVRLKDKKDIYLIASKNGQYGLYKQDKQIIKTEYQSIIATDKGALIIEKNGQFGIANKKGEIKVEPKYTQIEENGVYLYAQNVRENDVYDADGNKIDINFSKSVFETENEDYRITTLVNNDVTYYGVEDKNGANVLENRYNYIEYAYGDYFIVGDKKEKYGVMDSDGRVILEIKYDFIQKIRNKKILQVFKRKSNKIEFYSAKMEEMGAFKSASIQNENGYVKIFNKKEQLFLDEDGNKIDENSEIVQNDLKKKLPVTIKSFKKKQITLDDVYYE